MRKDVEEIRALHAGNLDAARPEAVAKRRKTGHWTAREQLDGRAELGRTVVTELRGKSGEHVLHEVLGLTDADRPATSDDE